MTLSKKNQIVPFFPAIGMVACVLLAIGVLVWLRPDTDPVEPSEADVEAVYRSQDVAPSPVSLDPAKKPRAKKYKYVHVNPADLPQAKAAPPAAAIAKPSESKLVGGSVDQSLAKAIDLVDNGNAEEAAAILKEVLKLDPHNEQALVEMGMIQLIDFRKPDQALPYLEKALESNPDNRIVVAELAGLYDELGKTQDGLDFFTKVAKENPSPSALIAKSHLLSTQGKSSEAAEAANQAAQMTGDAAMFANSARLFKSSGDIEKAQEAASKAKAGYEQKRDSTTNPHLKKTYEKQISSIEKEYFNHSF